MGEIKILSDCCHAKMKSVGQLKNVGNSIYRICSKCGKKCSPKNVDCDQDKLESLKYPEQNNLLEFI